MAAVAHLIHNKMHHVQCIPIYLYNQCGFNNFANVQCIVHLIIAQNYFGHQMLVSMYCNHFHLISEITTSFGFWFNIFGSWWSTFLSVWPDKYAIKCILFINLFNMHWTNFGLTLKTVYSLKTSNIRYFLVCVHVLSGDVFICPVEMCSCAHSPQCPSSKDAC